MQEIKVDGKKEYKILLKVKRELSKATSLIDSDYGEYEDLSEMSICENQIQPILNALIDIIDEKIICKK